MYELELAKKAAKFYQKADTSTVRRLNAAFDRLAEDPFHHYNIKPLSGEMEGSYRLRIGNILLDTSTTCFAWALIPNHFHLLLQTGSTPIATVMRLIGHTTIVMLRYLFLAFEQRLHDDPRTLGSLFYACSEEMKDLSVLEALQRILSLALDKIRKTGVLAEDIMMDILDAVMSVAIDMLKPPLQNTIKTTT